MNRRRPPIAVEDLVALRRKVDKPPIIPQKLLCEALQSSMSGPAERRVSTAVPLGDRQRRSDDADGSVYVSPVGPPLLVTVVRRMCGALCT